jgi:hypothetical protein
VNEKMTFDVMETIITQAKNKREIKELIGFLNDNFDKLCDRFDTIERCNKAGLRVKYVLINDSGGDN